MGKFLFSVTAMLSLIGITIYADEIKEALNKLPYMFDDESEEEQAQQEEPQQQKELQHKEEETQTQEQKESYLSSWKAAWVKWMEKDEAEAETEEAEVEETEAEVEETKAEVEETEAEVEETKAEVESEAEPKTPLDEWGGTWQFEEGEKKKQKKNGRNRVLNGSLRDWETCWNRK